MGQRPEALEASGGGSGRRRTRWDQGHRFACLHGRALYTNLGIRKTNKRELRREILFLFIFMFYMEIELRFRGECFPVR